ncbi:MAG: hypothetical protein ACOYJY_07160 [Acutalibacteraceae bacterium]|jgi:hypothetical protein
MATDMTIMQKQMRAANGHRVDVTIKDGHRHFVGKCVCYTPPIDNDPEVATMDIDIGIPRSLTEIKEEEIESIEFLD